MAAGVAGPRPGVTGARPAVQRSRSRSCPRCGPNRTSRSRASGTRSRTPGINPRPALDVFGQLRTLTEQAGREPAEVGIEVWVSMGSGTEADWARDTRF